MARLHYVWHLQSIMHLMENNVFVINNLPDLLFRDFKKAEICTKFKL